MLGPAGDPSIVPGWESFQVNLRPGLALMKTASELMMDDLAKRLGSRAKAEKMVAAARRELRKEEAAWKKRKKRGVK